MSGLYKYDVTWLLAMIICAVMHLNTNIKLSQVNQLPTIKTELQSKEEEQHDRRHLSVFPWSRKGVKLQSG